MRNTYNKYQKISKRKDISFLFKNGNKWKTEILSILYKKNYSRKDRCAIIVSKKNGNAVERNRIKRIFREVFRTNKRKNPPFYDFIFKPEPGHKVNIQEAKSAFLSWISELEK